MTPPPRRPPPSRPLRLALTAVLVLLLPGAPRAGTAGRGEVDRLVDRVLEAYGGREALARSPALKQTGRVSSTMRSGAEGSLVRGFQRPDRLRVEVVYPGEQPEVRVLDGTRGWRQGRDVSGSALEAMVLQAARLALPYRLHEARAQLKDAGEVERDGKRLRVLELPLGGALRLTVEVDPDSGHILRTTGHTAQAEFAAHYRDFRKVDGLLFSFHEVAWAMGQKTADTRLERVEVLDALPERTFRP